MASGNPVLDGLECVGALCTHENMRNLLQEVEKSESREIREKVVTSLVLVFGLIVLFKDVVRTEFVMIGMNLALVWFRIVDVKEAISGFSSSGILTVMSTLPLRR